MTKKQLDRLTQIYETIGLIHATHSFEMAPEEEVLFSRAVADLFDLMEEDSPNQAPPGFEGPATLEEQWKALK